MAIVQEWEDVRRERAELLARWEGREKDIVRLRAEVERLTEVLEKIRDDARADYDHANEKRLPEAMQVASHLGTLADDALASPPSAPTPRYDRATVEPTDMPGCAPHGSHGCKAFGDEVRRETVERG